LFEQIHKLLTIELSTQNTKLLTKDLGTQNSKAEALPQNDLEALIGTIPFLLLNQDVFEKNQDIAEFAKRLNIIIPSPEKKKREDIIGRIVSSIAKFDGRKIRELNLAIKAVKNSDMKKGKSNFFK